MNLLSTQRIMKVMALSGMMQFNGGIETEIIIKLNVFVGVKEG